MPAGARRVGVDAGAGPVKRRRRGAWLVALVTGGLLAAVIPTALGTVPDAEPAVRAGVGIADATWHVGAGAGQYAGKEPNATGLLGGEVDPHGHSTMQRRSYGVHSRLTYRAIVVEGADGERVALIKSDAYLAQDMLLRRTAQILADGDSGITHDRMLLMASHNHSSPYYTTPAAGVWLFQDAVDLRAFEYSARQLAAAVEQAAADLRPMSIGATTVEHRVYKGNIAGATVADDGTPAGYPDDHADFGLSVIRFDDVSGPQPEPLAVFANFGQHPESLDGYDLITADFLAPLERFVERDLGAPLIFSQGDVGSAEGPYLRGDPQVLPDGVVRAWAHVGHAQTERGARYLADSIGQAWRAIGAGDGVVPMSTEVPVAVADAWIPGPVSHPYPSMSNCRTESTVEGSPGAPIVGLPDCGRAGESDPSNMIWENLKAHGLPVPDHYDAPSAGSVEENARLRLQVVRLGEIVLASCACEAQMDLILNLESRIDNVEANIFNGYDWGAACSPAGDDDWACPFQGETLTVSDERYQRMRAQVNNDAAGWDRPENAVAANSEPADPERIWGNFTHTELPAGLGYALPIGVGHAGDYNGYTVSYREYMSRDHYRKALTSYGPHTADYMNTRLMAMAGSLKGGPALEPEPHAVAGDADEARQEALARELGIAAATAYDAWQAGIPDDIGPAEALEEPRDITRFAAATFTWRGGDNATDNPRVTVQRRIGDGWQRYADQTGEVQTKVAFPEGADGLADTYAGNHEWLWTANFEAFSAFPATVIDGGRVPAGEYRFVVDGDIRQDGRAVPYRLESQPFTVSPWTGVTADDAQVDARGNVSFRAESTYPRSYDSPWRYVRDDGNETLCKTCSFRPWASGAPIASAAVTVIGGPRPDRTVSARLVDGRWVANTRLRPGESAVIEPGDLVDQFGERNGDRITLTSETG
ncbi:MAG: hypothetical protein GEU86_12715 [Actinophytocola sp.]|nr:hypothetical protein [Actinophytocola sp.]